MNILELLKKLFKKNTVHVDTCSLIDIKNLIQIPKRNKYRQDKSMLDTIDDLKKEYRSILIQDKTVTSIDLHSKKLQDELNKFLNILNENYFSIGGYTGLDILDEEILLSYKTNLLKLGIYKDKIKELQKEIELRLIALNELSIRIKLSRSKNKDALNEEITNLSYAYYIYENEYMAIEKAIESFKHIVLTNTSKITQDYDKYKEARLKRMSSYLKEILPDIYTELKDLDEDIKLALLEFYLELWAHDKNNIDDTLLLLDELTCFDDIDISDTENNKEVLKLIKDIEPRLRTIYEFNKKEIQEKDLNILYKIKLLVLSIQYKKETPFDSVYDLYRDSIKYTIYEKVIEKAIEKMQKGIKTNYHNGPIYYSDKAINTSISIFKSDNGQYDIDAILTSPQLLYLLFLITEFSPTDDEIIDFFDNIMVPVVDELQEDNRGIVLEEEIPISSVYGLIGEWNEKIFDKFIKLVAPCKDLPLFYALYKLYSQIAYDLLEDGTYELPKGIKKYEIEHISLMRTVSLMHTEKSIQGIIQENLKRNIEKGHYYFALPESMEEFNEECLYYHNGTPGILELNEGLKKYIIPDSSIEVPALQISELIIPSTLERIDWEEFSSSTLECITFLNYTNSKILKNKTLIKRLIRKYINFADTYRGSLKIRVIFENNNQYYDVDNLLYESPIYASNKEAIDFLTDKFYEKIEEFTSTPENDKKLTK